MTDNSNNKSAMTTVKTVYARAALMVMCANLLLTGYAIASLANIQSGQKEDLREQAQQTATSTPTSTPSEGVTS